MDLSTLRGMLKVSADKSAPATRVSSPSLEVEEVHVEAAPRTVPFVTPKRPAEKSTSRQEDPTRTHKRTKVVVGKHKSRHGGEGASRAPSKDKGPVAPSEELAPPARRRPKSMKELCGTTIRKNDEGYYVVHMADLPSQDLDSDM
ncbi:hypothetical protein BHE74_00033165 [Ensete ventricosum]|nr:hypothetical protein BHE74_00033165 [Ensete ventricosum]